MTNIDIMTAETRTKYPTLSAPTSNPKLVWLVIMLGFALRLLVPVFIPGVTRVLDQSVLFSTPINSFRSLEEALFLSFNNMNPYHEGEIVHHPPLVLELFKFLESPIPMNIFLALMDSFCGIQLIKLNKKLRDHDNDRSYYPDYVIAAFYSFNPLALLTVYAKSTNTINNFVFLTALNAFASNPLGLSCMVLIAMSAYLSYYGWYFIIPMLLFAYKKASKEGRGAGNIVFKSIFTFLLTLMVLLGISYKISGSSFRFASLVYGTIVRFRKITPNLGLWWYFFTEIFDAFSQFYLGIFNLYSFIFVVPITMRFIGSEDSSIIDAIFTVWSQVGILNISRAYPTIADNNIYFSMMILFKPLYRKLKFAPSVSTLAMFTILLLLPVFYYVWMGANSGNANFFYAIGLTHTLIEMVVLSDFFWSKLQLNYYKSKGIDPNKKELKLTQI